MWCDVDRLGVFAGAPLSPFTVLYGVQIQQHVWPLSSLRTFCASCCSYLVFPLATAHSTANIRCFGEDRCRWRCDLTTSYSYYIFYI